MKRIEWLHCPVCGSKTRLQIRADTELKNFPLYCPKCKQESLINAKDLQVTVIKNLYKKEPDAEPITSRTFELLLSALSFNNKIYLPHDGKRKKPSFSRYFLMLL